MAHSPPHHPSTSPQKPTFRPLTVVQENAIDALLLGHTDGEVAAAVGVDRGTVWGWRHEHPLFQSELQRRRAALWQAPQERLRSLALKAVANLAAAVEAGDLKASIELLKCIGLYGAVAPIGETDPHAVLAAQVEAQLERECPKDVMHDFLIDQARPGWHARKRALEAEFHERYLEPSGGK